MHWSQRQIHLLAGLKVKKDDCITGEKVEIIEKLQVLVYMYRIVLEENLYY